MFVYFFAGEEENFVEALPEFRAGTAATHQRKSHRCSSRGRNDGVHKHISSKVCSAGETVTERRKSIEVLALALRTVDVVERDLVDQPYGPVVTQSAAS